jgi:hypothetical protein
MMTTDDIWLRETPMNSASPLTINGERCRVDDTSADIKAARVV